MGKLRRWDLKNESNLYLQVSTIVHANILAKYDIQKKHAPNFYFVGRIYQICK